VRRFLLVLVVAAAGLASPVMPHAAACSCAGDATQWLSGADGAFVGALLFRDEDPPPVDGVYWSGTLVRHHYQVEQAVRGDLPPTIDVWGTTDGASCGLGTPVGRRVGLLLQRDGTRWNSGLCSIADPDALVQAAQLPPPPSETVLPSVLAGSDSPPLDRRPLLAVGAAALLAITGVAGSRRRRRAPSPTVL
jgi:hypothetical protein